MSNYLVKGLLKEHGTGVLETFTKREVSNTKRGIERLKLKSKATDNISEINFGYS